MGVGGENLLKACVQLGLAPRDRLAEVAFVSASPGSRGPMRRRVRPGTEARGDPEATRAATCWNWKPSPTGGTDPGGTGHVQRRCQTLPVPCDSDALKRPVALHLQCIASIWATLIRYAAWSLFGYWIQKFGSKNLCMHGILNKVYLRNLFTDGCNFA